MSRADEQTTNTTNTERAEEPPRGVRIALSELAERLIANYGGQRNQDFVRAFSMWFQQKAHLVTFEAVEQLGLQEVVVTFIMKDRVRLVVTGYVPDFPGEVSLRAEEQDFPGVWVLLEREPKTHPYAFCTLDYLLSGRRFQLTASHGPHPAGACFEIIVHSTVGAERSFRVQATRPFNIPEDKGVVL